ncbi:fimbrial biogenesis chaperone [Oceanithermus profundus]|uniref:Pili assembly chaperone N-terminal domain-containing protein n=1 Tax=Oceanithermus profundus (strain DSM 14977 / NBRC 100410 / VKM B-2274 / 506) TaxID=670487 RepID=E4U9M0_OCEP5|nr:hypothetical protein [Oceanithermus profundus]ADR37184.1 hypothetical protein Ocepr_1731 [Oceanithermus profundus DSM 14977]
MRIRAIAPLLTVLAACIASPAWAQTAVAIDPPAAIFTARPGEEKTASILIANPGAEPTRVRVSLGDWMYQPDGQPVYLDPGSLPESASSWITFSPAEFMLAGREKKIVRYTIKVPEDAAAGTHWSVLFLQGEDPNAQPGANIATFKIRVAHTIYVNVPPIEWDGQILGIAAVPPDEPDQPIAIAIQYANTGNGAYAVTGRLEVRDAGGNVVGEAEIDRTVVLPGATRVLLANFFGPIKKGDYVILAVLNYGSETVDVAGQTVVSLPFDLVKPAPAAKSEPETQQGTP